MAQPLTLLHMQGVPDVPVPLDEAALVLIDIQEDYRTGLLPLDRVNDAAVAAGALLAMARDAGVPVFHVRHSISRDAPMFNPTLPTFAFMAEVAPRPGEAVIEKALPNAFTDTALDAAIRRTGRSALIFAGMQSHLCVSATVRSALDHGYRSTVVAAGCATRALPAPGGGILAAEDVHRVALAELADAFATVVPDAAAWHR